MQNSWYLQKNQTHHFVCTCGQHDKIKNRTTNHELDFEIDDFNRDEIELISIPDVHYPDNQCSRCHNEKYLDLEALVFNKKIKYWSNINWEYEEHTDGTKWEVLAFLKIPKLDNLSQIMGTERIELSHYTVHQDGKHYYDEKEIDFLKKSILVEEQYSRINHQLQNEVKKKMVHLIHKTPSKNITWLENKETSLESLLFFLTNPNIRSEEMFQWQNKTHFLQIMNQESYLNNCLAYFRNHRQEKSIQKAQFISYKAMMQRKGYNPMVDYIFCRTIHDVNHLHKLLEMPVEIKEKLFNGNSIENIQHFMNFLKQYYHEKHIVTFWLKVDLENLTHYLVRDTIRLFHNEAIRDELSKSFQKTALNIDDIHHALTIQTQKLESMKQEIRVFSYPTFLIETQGTTEGIRYELPIDTKMLYKWGRLLHNCLFSYESNILYGQSIIFGLFIDHKLTYAIELRNHKIVQASALYNTSLSKNAKAKIERWHKEIYLKNLIKTFD